MKFTKMHGCGNDYVYVNCLEEKINNPNKVAKFISDGIWNWFLMNDLYLSIR